VAGRSKAVGIPIHFSATPAKMRMPAPELGQHTEEVLLEIGGYGWDEIIALKEAGIIL
jgi:crotonobetainyl-CoA:carnitine CoA-transferase CaiB-like acyl-CoA transferase